MFSSSPPRSRGASFWVGLVLVITLFGVPLFVDLGEWDAGNDEAIYSYAVQRMVSNGSWMTPKSIPGDGPFFEKPPLKFWIVAAGMTSGLLPRTDFGMRFFDALFGLVIFVYVYLIGWRLSGAVCGLVSALTLFTLWPFVFQHGLRSNNMEAAVALGYAGGIYHWLRWAEGDSRPRVHAAAVTAYFFLAFMTKLVAAFFLPAIGVVALFWGGPGLRRVRAGWRDWILPSLVFVALASPWFIYHTIRNGTEGLPFWHVLIGEHVLTRFTSYLDPTHVHPWYYYFTATWDVVARAGIQILIAAGLVRLLVAVVRHESWVSRLVFVWAALPLVAISFGTSKLLHYAYPFWPPIALAAGLAAASLVRVGLTSSAEASSASRMRGARGMRLVAVVALVLLLPAGVYVDELKDLRSISHPLRALRDCVNTIRVAQTPGIGSGVLLASGDVFHHAYYYYFRRQGFWTIPPSFSKPQTVERLRVAGELTPVLVQRDDYERLYDPAIAAAEPLHWTEQDGVVVDDDVAMLLPGPFAQCVQPALDAGARPLWRPATLP